MGTVGKLTVKEPKITEGIRRELGKGKADIRKTKASILMEKHR